ncbi:TPA: selenium-binding protein, partial [Candidatus Micrarchaeota archaeon]|nr:selenium-binding protein [Candidatus Micrarchaeota archaeon]
GVDNEQFLKLYHWDGKTLKEAFAIDFIKEKLGRPHQMRFGARSLYSKRTTEGAAGPLALLP